jgi:hypothetical protein
MPEQPPTVDEGVEETLCLGKINVTLAGPLATIVFTHARPKAAPLLDQGIIAYESVVRARIVTTTENLVALRDIINTLVGPLSAAARDAPESGGELN